MTVPVNVDNFVRAETARMFDDMLKLTGGVNEWFHFRAPTPLNSQPVIRMNRDTLYSAAVVDISDGAILALPEADGRYMTVMVVNEDHYINRVIDEPGTYDLTVDEFDTEYVTCALRTLVDPSDPTDIAKVNALQDKVELNAKSDKTYEHPDYDSEGLMTLRETVLKLGEAVPDTDRTFGRKSDVDPVRHFIGTALGWGGLPESEAYYYIESSPRPTGRYTFQFRDVPVDAFWSVTIYNRDGYLEENPYKSYSINSLTGVRDDDGGVTLNLAPEGNGLTNHLYIMDGWNYALRLYKPRESVVDRSWTPPEPHPAD